MFSPRFAGAGVAGAAGLLGRDAAARVGVFLAGVTAAADGSALAAEEANASGDAGWPLSADSATLAEGTLGGEADAGTVGKFDAAL